MKRFCAPAVLLLALSSEASAADYWNEFYAGVNAGYGLTNAPSVNNTFDATPGAGPIAYNSPNLAISGFVGGGQVGFNRRFGTNFLAGIEADYQRTGQSFSTTTALAGGDSQTISGKLSYLGTVRGRFGYLTPSANLIYATAGLAYGGVNLTVADNLSNYAGAPSVNGGGTISQTRVGFAIGAGVETEIFGNWSARLEYLYADLGTISGTVPIVANGVPFGTHTGSINIRDNIARGGVNYRF